MAKRHIVQPRRCSQARWYDICRGTIGTCFPPQISEISLSVKCGQPRQMQESCVLSKVQRPCGQRSIQQPKNILKASSLNLHTLSFFPQTHNQRSHLRTSSLAIKGEPLSFSCPPTRPLNDSSLGRPYHSPPWTQ